MIKFPIKSILPVLKYESFFPDVTELLTSRVLISLWKGHPMFKVFLGTAQNVNIRNLE